MTICEQIAKANRMEEKRDGCYSCRAIEYLEGVAQMEKRYQSKSLYCKHLQSIAEGTSARPMGPFGARFLNGREEILASLADTEMELEKDLIRLRAVHNQTWELFYLLSHPKGGQVLEDYYLCHYTIRLIAGKLGYSERNTYRVKEQALLELGKLLEKYGIAVPCPIPAADSSVSYLSKPRGTIDFP